MPRRGRPSKSGKRTKSGKLANREPSRVPGNDRAMAMRARFSSYATEALGRAYFAGLLGGKDDPIAMERFRKGAELANVWRRHYACPSRCALNDNPRGATNITEGRRAQNEYHWMRREIDALDREGFGSWFHEFVLAENPDGGPAWLDRLLDGEHDMADERILEVNIKALDSIGAHRDRPVRKAVDIPLHACHVVRK